MMLPEVCQYPNDQLRSQRSWRGRDLEVLLKGDGGRADKMSAIIFQSNTGGAVTEILHCRNPSETLCPATVAIIDELWPAASNDNANKNAAAGERFVKRSPQHVSHK